MPLLATNGNEITDAIRANALLGIISPGGMTDGRSNDSSFGVHRAATNLFPNGQCNNISGWTTGGSGGTMSATLDATVPAPFNLVRSVKITFDGSNNNQGLLAFVNGSWAAGTNIAGSVFFKGEAGRVYKKSLRYSNGTTEKGNVTVNFTASGSWEIITPDFMTIQTGDTAVLIRLYVQTTTAVAGSFNVAHCMIESGQTVVAPYVATDGTSQTHSNAVVTCDSTALNPTQVWFAGRLRYGWGSTNVPNTLPRFFEWQNAGGTDFVRMLFSPAGRQWSLSRSGDANTLNSTALTFNAGDFTNLIGAVTSTQLKMSINGAAFTSIANAGVPVNLPTVWRIGDSLGFNRQIDSDYMWMMTGIGTLTDADAATLAALGNTTPTFSTLPRTAQVMQIIPFDTTAFSYKTYKSVTVNETISLSRKRKLRTTKTVAFPVGLIKNKLFIFPPSAFTATCEIFPDAPGSKKKIRQTKNLVVPVIETDYQKVRKIAFSLPVNVSAGSRTEKVQRTILSAKTDANPIEAAVHEE